MVRTQVQLTEAQIQALRLLSVQRKKSMADLVRESVDLLLREQERVSPREQALHYKTFGSGPRDLSARHDDYFAEAVENSDDR